MSLQAMQTSSSGLLAQSQRLAVVANNVANLSTRGFKKARAQFADLMYEVARAPGTSATGADPGLAVAFGSGTTVINTQTDFRQGAIQQTGRPLDVAISGSGFFIVQDGQGNLFFTRAGNFTLNAEGQLRSGSRRLDPGVAIPPGTETITISGDGTVLSTVADSDEPVVLGRLLAGRFSNPEGLIQFGDNLFAQSAASGEPDLGQFGQDGFGTLQQGFLEDSNVEPVEELVELLASQHAFALNAQVFRAADERLRLVSQLRQ